MSPRSMVFGKTTSARPRYNVGIPARETFSEHWIDVRMSSGIRLMLAASALLVVHIDPSEPGRFVAVTYAAVILYIIYSLAFYILSINRSDLLPVRLMHWLDVAWYLLIIVLGTGINSAFFFFFFFPILVASFGWGFTSGFRVTLVSAVLFMMGGYFLAPSGSEFELSRFLFQPIYMLILGYMISHWGGFEVELKRRLHLLKQVTLISNPRFGIDRTINSVIESLRSSYDAESCLLVISRQDQENRSYRLLRVTRENLNPAVSAPNIDEQMAGPFLLHAAGEAVIYQKAFQKKTLLLDVNTGRTSFGDSATSDKVASVLDAGSYVSVPVTYRNEPIGRLFIIGGRRKFDVSDIDFVLQLIDHLTPVLENIRLIDNLASDAAEQERQRIARDIHDSVIQPYVGLQFGLAALRQKLEAGIDVIADVKELLDLTNDELADLRGYVRNLRAGDLRHDVLLPALKRFTEKFSWVTGINVEVEAHCEAHITDSLAGELFQIVTEGLSNIRRHTRAREAKVELTCQGGVVLLQIKNRTMNTSGNTLYGSDGDRDGMAVFTPRSIAERAKLLGGHTEVFLDENNYTVVSVGIPL